MIRPTKGSETQRCKTHFIAIPFDIGFDTIGKAWSCWIWYKHVWMYRFTSYCSFLCHNCHYCMASKAHQVFPTQLYSCRSHLEHVLFLINTECTAYCWDEDRERHIYIYILLLFQVWNDWEAGFSYERNRKRPSLRVPSLWLWTGGGWVRLKRTGFMWSERGTTREWGTAGLSPTGYGDPLVWPGLTLTLTPGRGGDIGRPDASGTKGGRDGLSKASFINRIWCRFN